jgi:protein SCO1/2
MMKRTRMLRIATIALVLAGAGLAWLSWRERAVRLQEAERAAAATGTRASGSAIDRAFRGPGGADPPPAAQILPGGNLFAAPGTWRDQSGTALTLAQLAGRPVVLTFIYATCDDACPLIVQSMKAGRERLAPDLRDRAQWLLISIDPEQDPPPVLRGYAEQMKLGKGSWRLLTAPESVVRPVAELVGFHYQRVGRHFSHNAVIAVASAEGDIVGWFADERITDAELLGRGLTRALSL